MPLAPELLEIVACPRCKQKVTLVGDESGFACARCSLLFPIVDGLPDFLLEDARPLVPAAVAKEPSSR